MLDERAPSPCFNEGDLSKDFGLDITVSDGGLVSSAANQRQYQSECTRIYQQFVLNMADYINEEAQLRKTLTLLQSQQKKTPRQTIGRITPHIPKTPDIPDEDAFTAAQLEEFQNILQRENCRSKLSHASGFAAADVTTPDGPVRGQTPKSGHRRSISSLVNQPPVTHMFPALKERPPSVKATQLKRETKGSTSGEEDKKRATPSSPFAPPEVEYDGIMESNTELSNNRRIRVNPRAFTRLMTDGQVKVKLLNKHGDFVLTPLMSNVAVLTPEETEKQLLDNKEKIALVKQRTTFQSPTLSSDLKISNLVAIQKALKGQTAKRVTVGEVMRSARDRRARLFRVQMSGNRFDEFDQQQEDLGYVHEVKAATDLGEDETDARPPSRARHMQVNILRQQENRPESRLRSPTPIPLHVLDPKAAHAVSRANTPGLPKQVSVDFSCLEVHVGGSDYEHRYAQAVEKNKPKDRQKPKMSVIQLGFDQPDAATGFDDVPENSLGHVPSGVFPVSQHSRVMRSKSAVSAPGQRAKRAGTATLRSELKTPHGGATSPPPASPPVKKINSMRDTATIVRRWQEEDREREEKLNRWRMRMSFAATRKGNLTKVLTRAKSGK
ncbi:uncharacterized protein LOC101858948 [Aplysia californica]|uniref:Uncharacterized protein LOC101858948 n=1 Tax=Aplysia californica TaxID=6500 RepID=A0ABM1VV57_APLCA|nr:uncharacterized protein LOC101858948 [Aplysia californica]XP_035826300.1 uncharacterized protein LOC101858948 [Aplysia californica]XP_035826302.1 uncharacterized protein LOC101858948 [Aplysia californica]XP_035826303.1 uncharacterized protein LOC101858948 [Aplysia californica]